MYKVSSRMWFLCVFGFAVLPGLANAAAGDDLVLVAKPACRVFELGEAVYVQCTILNPSGLAVRIGQLRVTVKQDKWEKARAVFPHAPFTRHTATHGDILTGSEKVIHLPLFDVGLDRKTDQVVFNRPGRVNCDMEIRIEIASGEERVLKAKTRFSIVERLFKYSPPLTRELRTTSRLYRFQAWNLTTTPTKPEFEAVEAFALANHRTPIGRNLLYQVAVRRAWAAQVYADVPGYFAPRTSPKAKLSIADVLTMSEEKRRDLLRSGAPVYEGRNTERAVEHLKKLLEGDDGNFARYDEAALLLAKELLRLKREEEAAEWCRRVAERGRAASARAGEADHLLAMIKDGTWPKIFLPADLRKAQERPPMEKAKLDAVLEKRFRMVLIKGHWPDMTLSSLISFVDQKLATRLPVVYEHVDIGNVIIPANDVGEPHLVTLRAYLNRVLSRRGLSFRTSKGRIVISREDAKHKKEAGRGE